MARKGVTPKEVLAAMGLVEELVVALMNIRAFAPDHPRILSSLEKIIQQVELLLVVGNCNRIRIGVMGGFILYRGEPLLGASLSATKLLRRVQKRRSDGLEFRQGLATRDLLTLLGLLSRWCCCCRYRCRGRPGFSGFLKKRHDIGVPFGFGKH